MRVALLLLVMGAILWYLFRLKQRDIANCAQLLGLAPVPRETVKGTTPEGFVSVQHTMLRGTLLGHVATLSERSVRHPAMARRSGRRSLFTVLELQLATPVRCSLRLQPEGTLSAVESLVRGRPDDRVPLDDAFDAAYVVYSDDPSAARAILSPARRQRVLAYRAGVANLPPTVAGRLASGMMLGSFHVEGTTARFLIYGSPTLATAEQVKNAAPVLVELASAASQN